MLIGIGGLSIPGASIVPAEGGFASQMAAFKAFLATTSGAPNPRSQTAMPSPPTITTSTSGSTVSATYPKQLQIAEVPADLAQVLAQGGTTNLRSGFFVAPDQGDGGGGNLMWTASRLGFHINADGIAFYVIGSSLVYRFLVDELDGNGPRYVDFTGTVPAGTSGTGNNFIILAFSAKAERIVWVEQRSGQGIRRAHIKTADSYLSKPVAKTYRMSLFGDSFGQGSGATTSADGLAFVAADYLGIEVLSASTGGTGYTQTNGASVKLSDRIESNLDVALGLGQLQLVTIAMGLNDGVGSPATLTADINSAFDKTRAKCPNALVFVVLPWDRAAPSAVDADYTTRRNIIVAAASGRPGFFVLDPEGVAFTKAMGDPNHPDTAGHATLGLWLDDAIRDLATTW